MLVLLDCADNIQTTELRWGRVEYFIHAVRDPLEMIVSAYLYHLRGAEGWVHVPLYDLDKRQESRLGTKWPARFVVNRSLSYFNFLQAANTQAGLLQVADDMLSGPISNMDAVARLADKSTYIVRMEDCILDFDGTFERMFRHINASGEDLTTSLKMAGVFDLKRHPHSPSAIQWIDNGSHVSDPLAKPPLYDLLSHEEHYCNRIRDSQKLHGYQPMVCLIRAQYSLS